MLNRRECLNKYKREYQSDKPTELERAKEKQLVQEPNKPTNEVINMKVEGITCRGDSNTSRKAYACLVYNVSGEQKCVKIGEINTFSDEVLRGIQAPYNDAMVILVMVANFEVKKIMIDNSHLIDILFYDGFKRMKLPANRLKPIVQSLLYGFNGDAIVPKKIITLVITLGTSPHHLNLMVNFIVVKYHLYTI